MYAAEGHLHFEHVLQLSEVLEVLEAVDHEQRQKANGSARRLKDEVCQEHLGLVELPHLSGRCVQPCYDYAFMVGFVEVTNERLNLCEQLLEGLKGQSTVFFQPQINQIVADVHCTTRGVADCTLEKIHKLSGKYSLTPPAGRHQVMALVLIVDLHVSCANEDH